MGFKQIELVPVASVTAITPTGKESQNRVFQATRTDLAAVTKLILPADASVVNVWFYGSVASDAGTTATLTITLVTNAGTISTGVVNVKANGATSAQVNMSALPNIEPLPLTGDILVQAVYAETGGAATVGGPWRVVVEFVR